MMMMIQRMVTKRVTPFSTLTLVIPRAQRFETAR